MFLYQIETIGANLPQFALVSWLTERNQIDLSFCFSYSRFREFACVEGDVLRNVLIASAMFGAVGTASMAGQFPAPVNESDFREVPVSLAELGQLLFFDPILSGNKNIACATCHHPTLGTSDAMSLSLGEGGNGLGPARIVDADNRPHQRIPRNAPALFNLGAHEFKTMFHDGRVEADDTAAFGIRMPEGRELERAVSAPLTAQTMLPMLSGDEMAGHPGENPIADAVAADDIRGEDGAWAMLAGRVADIGEYRDMFSAEFGRDEVHITDVAEALSAFISVEFRTTNSIYDRFLAGEVLMPDDAMRGAELFYGKANCSGCHRGPLLSDQDFHAIAMPQIGPGKGEGEDAYFQDTGRYAVTGDPADMYKFRTPSLRNVGVTAPYGHDGAFGTLEAVVRHHLDPIKSLRAYEPRQAALARDFSPTSDDMAALATASEIDAIAAANELAPVKLGPQEIHDIVAFLRCLTDPDHANGPLGVPATVPSGLPVE